MYLAAAQMLIAQTGKAAGPAIGYSSKEPAGGTSFRDLIRPKVQAEEEASPASSNSSSPSSRGGTSFPDPIRPQVQAEEETSPASSNSSSPSSRKTEAGSNAEEFLLDGGGGASERQPTAGTGSTAILAGGAVDSRAASGSVGDATDRQGIAVRAAAVADAGSDESSEAASSPNRAPAGHSNSSTWRQGDNAGFESGATDRNEQISPQQPRQSCDALVTSVPQSPDPVAAPVASGQAAFERKAEGAGDTHSSNRPGSTIARGEKKPEHPGSTGQQEAGQVPLAAYTITAAQPESVSGLDSGANPWAMAIRAPTAATTRARGEIGSNHYKLATVAIDTLGGLKKSETPLSTGHAASAGNGASASPSTIVAAESEQGLSADSRSAAVAALATSGATEPNKAISLSHQKAATTNTRTSAPASPATGRNPMEPAGEQGAGPVVGAIAAPRKAWSGGDIAHGSPQPEHSLTEVSAETAGQGVNAAPTKTMGHSGMPILAAGSMAHTPGSTGVESAVPSPDTTTLSPATHATSGTTVTPPSLPATVPATHFPHAPASATFERMDSAAAPEVMESTPQRLAVGVRSPGLGWVEIRTNNTAGQVSATVATGSVESHNALSAQLPSVREYLAGEHVRIDNLASERFSSSSGGGEGFSGGRSGNEARNEGSRNAESADEAIATTSADAEMESLSYINVRV